MMDDICWRLFWLIGEGVPGHSKIRHFYLPIMWNKTVPSSLQKKESQGKDQYSNSRYSIVDYKNKCIFIGLPDLCG